MPKKSKCAELVYVQMPREFDGRAARISQAPRVGRAWLILGGLPAYFHWRVRIVLSSSFHFHWYLLRVLSFCICAGLTAQGWQNSLTGKFRPA